MTKTVLDIGNCNPDHSAMEKMLSKQYDVVVLRAHQLSDSLELLSKTAVDLIVINRKLDVDYSDG
jgi:two-component SAPR family response regulator